MSVVEHCIYSELKRLYKCILACPQITQREVQKNWQGPFNIADSRRQKYDGSAIFSRRTTWLLCSKIACSPLFWSLFDFMTTFVTYFDWSRLLLPLSSSLCKNFFIWSNNLEMLVYEHNHFLVGFPNPLTPGDIQILCQLGIPASVKLRTYQGWWSINAFQYQIPMI